MIKFIFLTFIIFLSCNNPKSENKREIDTIEILAAEFKKFYVNGNSNEIIKMVDFSETPKKLKLEYINILSNFSGINNSTSCNIIIEDARNVEIKEPKIQGFNNIIWAQKPSHNICLHLINKNDNIEGVIKIPAYQINGMWFLAGIK